MTEVRKKLIRNLIIIIGIFVLVAIILLLYQGCSNKKLSYSQIENKLKIASQKYLKKMELLPTNEADIAIVGSEVLISNGYLKKMESMTDDKNCYGKVTVQKNGDKYDYMPYLKCDNYETSTLMNAIASNVVTEEDGLYYQNNEYVFKGKKVNNYLKFSNRLWRIIKITEDGYLKLISVDNEKNRYQWDDKYNIDVDKYYGINDFEKSEIKERLLEIYNDEEVISDKSKVVARNLCIGKRSKNDFSFNDVECSKKTEDKYFIDLPTNYDITIASTDKNCKNLESASCTNFNYFYDFFTESWSIIGVKEDSSLVYLARIANLYDIEAKSHEYVHIVIYINANTILKSGDGTEENPYKI